MTDQRLELTKVRQAHLYDDARASDRATVDLALIGLKSLLLVNGGAMVGLLTFLGHATVELSSPVLLWASFTAFVAGLGFALAATVFGYLAQSAFSARAKASADRIYFDACGDSAAAAEQRAGEAKHARAAAAFRGFGILWSVGSAAAFCVGGGFGIAALGVARISGGG